MEEEIEEEIQEETSLAKFGERAIRAPKGGAFERLLAQHLVLSVTSKPIDSIIHTCRATLSLNNNVSETLKIDKQKVSDILKVAVNLKNAQPNKSNNDTYDLRWSFEELGEEGYRRFIEPWLTFTVRFYLPHHATLTPEKQEAFMEKFEATPKWEQVYYSCTRLFAAGFHTIQSAFISWAYPFVEELNQKVSSQVSPTTYQEILGLFTKFKEAES